MKKNIISVVGVIATWIGCIVLLYWLGNLNSDKEIKVENSIDEIRSLDYYKDNSFVKYDIISRKTLSRSTEKKVMSEEELIKVLSDKVESEEDRLKRIELNEIRYQQNLKAQRELERQEELKRIALAEAKKKEEQKKAVKNVSVDNTYGSDWMTFEATYYSAFCDTCGGQGLTASGVSVANSIHYKGMRVIATNRNEIPMWSIVEVKAHYGTFKAVALDTGGFGAQSVDILVESTKTAYKLGRHDVQIRIIDKMK